MTKNKTIYVALRMNELEASKLDYIRQPGETRSAAIRRLISDEWVGEVQPGKVDACCGAGLTKAFISGKIKEKRR